MSNPADFIVRLFRILGYMGGGQAVQASLSWPHPPEYQSKIIMLILLIFNYLSVKMYKV